MSLISLLIISVGSGFGVFWLIQYVPLIRRMPFRGVYWSPRLVVCKLLIPFDISVTLWLIMGSVLGLATSVTGISMLVYNTLVALGISGFIYVLHRWIIPRWKKQYEKRKEVMENEDVKKGKV